MGQKGYAAGPLHACDNLLGRNVRLGAKRRCTVADVAIKRFVFVGNEPFFNHDGGDVGPAQWTALCSV